VLSLGLCESIHRRLPRADIADRRIKVEAHGFLLIQPFGEVAGGSTPGNHHKTVLVQTLTNGGSNPTHTACDVSYFFIHVVSPIGFNEI